jgi:hypothetical protein
MTNHISVLNEAIGSENAGKARAALNIAGYFIFKGDPVALERERAEMAATRKALEQAKAFIVAEHLAPAVQRFEIDARSAYREKIIAEIDRILSVNQK